jgi:predicted lipoprotein with Yx(FWY)xxD motif
MTSRLAIGARVLVLAAVVAVALSACGGSSSPPISKAGPAYEVDARSISGLGTVLVDGKGFTLYLFVPDEHSGRSTCTGACAVEWPPLLLPSGVTSPLAGGGVEKSLLGVTTRPNGSTQVTYDGWPLYLYVNDPSPGTATGQALYNLGGYWYAVSTNGSADQKPNPAGY